MDPIVPSSQRNSEPRADEDSASAVKRAADSKSAVSNNNTDVNEDRIFAVSIPEPQANNTNSSNPEIEELVIQSVQPNNSIDINEDMLIETQENELEALSPNREKAINDRELVEFKQTVKLKGFGGESGKGHGGSSRLLHSIKKGVGKFPRFFQKEQAVPTEAEIAERHQKQVSQTQPLKGILRRKGARNSLTRKFGGTSDAALGNGEASNAVNSNPFPQPIIPNLDVILQASFSDLLVHDQPTAPNSANQSTASLFSTEGSSAPSTTELFSPDLIAIHETGGGEKPSKFLSKKSKSAFDVLEAKSSSKRSLKFNPEVVVGQTHNPEDYSRQGEFVAKVLTPALAMAIKKELNEFKAEMVVHEESKSGSTQRHSGIINGSNNSQPALDDGSASSISSRNAAFDFILKSADIAQSVKEDKISGPATVALWQKSGLAPALLSQVWKIVNAENKPFLKVTEFCDGLRLIALAQEGKPLELNSLTGNPVPRLEGFNPPDKSLTSLSTNTSSISSGPSAEEYRKYSSIFNSANPVSNQLSAAVCRDIFVKSNLPNETLGKVWLLVNPSKKPGLTETEFVVSMFIIGKLADGSLKELPSSLPSNLTSQLGNNLPSLHTLNPNVTSSGSAASTPIGARKLFPDISTKANNVNSPGPGGMDSLPSPVIAPNSNPAPSSTISTNSTPQLSSTLPLISAEERIKADNYFVSLDKRKIGLLYGNDVLDFFKASKLPSTTLSTIWNMVDVSKNGALSKDEFAVALHLIQKALAGEPLVSPTLSSQPVVLPSPLAKTQSIAAQNLPSPAKVFPVSIINQSTNTSAQQQKETLSNQIRDLNYQSGLKEAELFDLQTKNSVIEKELHELSAKREEASVALANVTEQVKLAENATKDNMAKLQETRLLLNSHQSALEEAQKSLASINAEKSVLIDQLMKDEASLAEIRSRLSQLTMEIENGREDLKRKAEASKSNQSQLESLKAELLKKERENAQAKDAANSAGPFGGANSFAFDFNKLNLNSTPAVATGSPNTNLNYFGPSSTQSSPSKPSQRTADAFPSSNFQNFGAMSLPSSPQKLPEPASKLMTDDLLGFGEESFGSKQQPQIQFQTSVIDPKGNFIQGGDDYNSSKSTKSPFGNNVDPVKYDPFDQSEPEKTDSLDSVVKKAAIGEFRNFAALSFEVPFSDSGSSKRNSISVSLRDGETSSLKSNPTIFTAADKFGDHKKSDNSILAERPNKSVTGDPFGKENSSPAWIDFSKTNAVNSNEAGGESKKSPVAPSDFDAAFENFDATVLVVSSKPVSNGVEFSDPFATANATVNSDPFAAFSSPFAGTDPVFGSSAVVEPANSNRQFLDDPFAAPSFGGSSGAKEVVFGGDSDPFSAFSSNNQGNNDISNKNINSAAFDSFDPFGISSVEGSFKPEPANPILSSAVDGVDTENIKSLENMGFSRERAIEALRLHKNNLTNATNYLLDSN